VEPDTLHEDPFEIILALKFCGSSLAVTASSCPMRILAGACGFYHGIGKMYDYSFFCLSFWVDLVKVRVKRKWMG
jgi:hypothetical protein